MANTKKKSTNKTAQAKKTSTAKTTPKKTNTANAGKTKTSVQAKKSSTTRKTTNTKTVANKSAAKTATKRNKNEEVIKGTSKKVANPEVKVRDSKSKMIEEEKVEIKEVKEENKVDVKQSNNNNLSTIIVVSILVVAIIISCIVTSSKGGYTTLGNTGTNAGSSVEEESNNIKDSEKADLTSIGIDEYLSLLDGSDAAVIYIGRPTCSHCQVQKPIMEHLVYKYGVKINYLDTDELDDDGISKLQSSDDYFNEGWGTPLTIIVQNGEIKDKASGETSIEDLVSMFKQYNLIKE